MRSVNPSLSVLAAVWAAVALLVMAALSAEQDKGHGDKRQVEQRPPHPINSSPWE
jgi:hypothetical protein